jgi:hypothetical protein
MKMTNNLKAQSGTAIHLFLLTLALVVLLGCEDSTSQNRSGNEQNDLIMQAGKADDFYVLCSSLDDAKAPKEIVYLFNGVVQNNTDNTYANVTLRLNASIELENGTVLTKQEIDQNVFGGLLSLTTFRDFKPKAKVNIQRLESIAIPMEYADYPIKDVTMEYAVELEDQIHQTNEERVIKTVSVMDKWKRAVTKAKANKTDATDVNFPEKIIGQYWLK